MFKKILYGLVGLAMMVSFNIIGGGAFAQQSTDGTPEDVGISREGSCLTGMGKGCFSYDNLIRGKDSKLTQTNKKKTVMTIAQDVILGATYMVGTVLTVILLICGLMYIFSSGSGKDPSSYKKGLISAAIGAVLVRGAYAMVRLIQYIAKG